MRKGVDADRSGQPVVARSWYLQALEFAQTLIAGSGGDVLDADGCVAAFVVTHLNLADLCSNADQTHDAVRHVCTAHQTLMALMRDDHAAPGFHQAACRHSRETHAALLKHLSEHGSRPDILLALRAGCLPFPWAGATFH